MRRESSSLISARLGAPTGVRRSTCLVEGVIFYLEPPRGGLQNDMLVSLHTVQCTTPKQNELVLGSDETSGVTQSCDRTEQPIRVRRGFACRKDKPEELIGVNFGTG